MSWQYSLRFFCRGKLRIDTTEILEISPYDVFPTQWKCHNSAPLNQNLAKWCKKGFSYQHDSSTFSFTVMNITGSEHNGTDKD